VVVVLQLAPAGLLGLVVLLALLLAQHKVV
jgi:hypothetical protein